MASAPITTSVAEVDHIDAGQGEDLVVFDLFAPRELTSPTHGAAMPPAQLTR